MSKAKKDEDLMQYIDNLVKAFNGGTVCPAQQTDKKLTSGDEVFDKAVGDALKKGKPNK